MTTAARPARDKTPPPMGAPALVGMGLVLALITAAVVTPADADLWGHLTFGRDILSSGDPIQIDRYSFTTDRPWVNHEWLTEVIIAAIYGQAGSAGLILFKLGTIAVTLVLIWRYLARLGAPAGPTAYLLAVAFIGTYWRTHTVRPQLFSVLFFTILLIWMRDAEAGRRRTLLAVPPLMALWVNLHGGWIVGFGVLALWAAIHCRTPATRARRITLILLISGTLLASLLNPEGVEMWRFLAETVRLGREDIEEWGSIFTSPLALGLPWTLTLGTAVWAVWRAGGPRRLDALAIVAMLAFASLRVSRLDAFFALSVVILLAPELIKAWPAPAQTRAPAPEVSSPALGAVVITAVTALAILVPVAAIIRPYTTCLTMRGEWLPEADAGRFIQLNQLQGRLLMWFDWGEYAIWHFSPRLQVSIDGRRETLYTDRTIQAHRGFYAAADPELPLVRALNPDYIWIPARLRAAGRLTDEGWRQIFRGPVSIVFARAGAGPFREVAPSGDAPRCFPGP